MSTTYDDPRMQQCMDALAAANETRLQRAALKRAIKQGRVKVQRVILDPPWYMETMYVSELLMAQARWGKARALKYQREAQLPDAKRVGTMTERQRRVLVEVLAKVESKTYRRLVIA